MNRSKLFHIAHSIKAQFSTFGEALKHAWKVIRLKYKMKTSWVAFKFLKKDGSIREAIGTTNIPFVRKESNGKVNHSVMAFFDEVAQGWRSCKVESILF